MNNYRISKRERERGRTYYVKMERPYETEKLWKDNEIADKIKTRQRR